ncbi:MAG: peptidylprolyl isomerase [Chloroflexi bacterium]|jgi:FKBP-type peptidyl-prolyl cis-trans isomerase SlyD|nr:peptidylprolyl isomerase [Chloroflexota bacterium]MBV6436508.1 FKBP-type peptidyl-prolyl cis-trans isomerase SlyD [Anaerolineae bacterium]MDL1917175.1 peptidylprolyl isomerase [Anaerolineae bacterium CFX4]RIK18777.1 MAG: peptidylprolyl isomerase [Chloroflexota bacterium]
MSDTITSGKVVSLVLTMTVDGQIVEQYDAENPFDYLHGAETIVPGLEAALDNRKVGDKLTVTVPPAEGFGEYDAEYFEILDEDEVEGAELGMEIMLEDDEGYIYEGVITEIHDGEIKVDLNPMLAGKTLTYQVEVVGLRDADAEELEHGHVHGADLDEDWDDEDWDDEDDNAEDEE